MKLKLSVRQDWIKQVEEIRSKKTGRRIKFGKKEIELKRTS